MFTWRYSVIWVSLIKHSANFPHFFSISNMTGRVLTFSCKLELAAGVKIQCWEKFLIADHWLLWRLIFPYGKSVSVHVPGLSAPSHTRFNTSTSQIHDVHVFASLTEPNLAITPETHPENNSMALGHLLGGQTIFSLPLKQSALCWKVGMARVTGVGIHKNKVWTI